MFRRKPEKPEPSNNSSNNTTPTLTAAAITTTTKTANRTNSTNSHNSYNTQHRASVKGGKLPMGKGPADPVPKVSSPGSGCKNSTAASAATVNSTTSGDSTSRSLDQPVYQSSVGKGQQTSLLEGTWDPSHAERELIRRSWSDDFDFLFRIGAAIYNYIFENNPQTRQLFPAIHQWGDKWRESVEFRSQALRFVQTLAHAVQKIYRLEEVAANVHAIGRRHVKYAHRGFKPEYWDMFQVIQGVQVIIYLAEEEDLYFGESPLS